MELQMLHKLIRDHLVSLKFQKTVKSFDEDLKSVNSTNLGITTSLLDLFKQRKNNFASQIDSSIPNFSLKSKTERESKSVEVGKDKCIFRLKGSICANSNRRYQSIIDTINNYLQKTDPFDDPKFNQSTTNFDLKSRNNEKPTYYMNQSAMPFINNGGSFDQKQKNISYQEANNSIANSNLNTTPTRIENNNKYVSNDAEKEKHKLSKNDQQYQAITMKTNKIKKNAASSGYSSDINETLIVESDHFEVQEQGPRANVKEAKNEVSSNYQEFSENTVKNRGLDVIKASSGYTANIIETNLIDSENYEIKEHGLQLTAENSTSNALELSKVTTKKNALKKPKAEAGYQSKANERITEECVETKESNFNSGIIDPLIQEFYISQGNDQFLMNKNQDDLNKSNEGNSGRIDTTRNDFISSNSKIKKKHNLSYNSGAGLSTIGEFGSVGKKIRPYSTLSLPSGNNSQTISKNSKKKKNAHPSNYIYDASYREEALDINLEKDNESSFSKGSLNFLITQNSSSRSELATSILIKNQKNSIKNFKMNQQTLVNNQI